MNNKFLLISIVFLIFSAMMGACQPQAEFSPETDLSRQTAVTLPSPSASPEATSDYGELSQEALAALIHTTAVEMEITAKAAAGAMADGVLTDEEISKTATNTHALQTAIQFTDQLIEIYAALYGEIAHETTIPLLAIDEDLKGIAAQSNEVITFIEQDKDAIEADELAAALPSLESQATKMQTQSGIWLLMVQTGIAEREKWVASTPPEAAKVAYNRVDAFIQAHDFWDAFTTALNDEKISPAELAHLSQLAATAKSSLYNTGDPELMHIAQQINALTHQAARGEWKQASSGLSELKFSLPARPRP